MVKLKFIKDHSPRKTGDVVVFKGREDERTAQWYLSNGIAELAPEAKKGSGCADCDKKESEKIKALTEENERLKSEVERLSKSQPEKEPEKEKSSKAKSKTEDK